MKNIWKLINVIIIVVLLTQFSCDDRTPTENTSSNYSMTMTTQPVAGNDLSGENVGEDLLGDIVTTKVTAILKDNDDKAIKDALISFSSKKGNSPYGQMSPTSRKTDENGTAEVLFKDPGDVAAFGESKALLKAEYSNNTGVFAQALIDVYPDTLVWPYSISIASSINQIFKTTNPQSSTLTIYVYNKLNNPVQSVYVDLTTDVGSFGDSPIKEYTVLTDNLGRGTVAFNHNEELGLATITAYYSHEGVNGTQLDSTQVLIGTDYNIILSQYPVSQNSSGNWIIVGEDIVGDSTRTRLIGTITDNSGNPVQDEQILFSAESQGASVGTITTTTNVTNSDGQVFAYFDDDETVYQDQSGTQDFDGVTCTAFIGDITGENHSVQFSVFTTEVWPYLLTLITDEIEITLDNGETFATLSGRLLNDLSQPVSNVILSFSADRGYLIVDPPVTTDNNGEYTLIFRDLGEPSDVGLATITGSFTHPGFDSTITNTAHVAIVTNYSMALSSYSVSMNESGNPVFVGEDVAGDNARTRIVATVTDALGEPVSDQLLIFSANSLENNNVGSFVSNSYTTDGSGKVYAYFLDNVTAYQDQSGTPDFEGVTVTVFIGDETGENQSVQFSVYTEADVWPYHLSLNTDVDEITLDNGQTEAVISGILLNGLNTAVSTVILSFSSDRGYIIPQVTTDSDGDYSLNFQDLGEPSDVGLATITGSFTHPGFDSTIVKTAQVAIVTNYSMALSSYSVSLNDDGNSVVVGEDVAGDNARTRIVATVTDQAGNLIPGQTIYFNAEVLGDQDVGSFDAEMYSTNNQGKVFAYFLDNETAYQDQSGTPDFEGVTVTGYIGDETGESESVQFSVYGESTVWPYQLSLNTDVNEITLDNGQTEAVISGILLNGLNTAVGTVILSFSSDRGYIIPQVTTDSNGDYSLNFQDLGEPSDVGLATITGSFTHPGFDSTITNTAHVAIVTNYTLMVESYSVSMDENNSPVFVGEDVSEDNARTRIVGTVTDELGEPVSGQLLIFSANSLENNNVGSFVSNSYITDGTGKVYVYFLDDGNSYQDQTGTQDFEGVTVTVFIGDETGEWESVAFSVYPTLLVWPYDLSLYTNVDMIYLDNGETEAIISSQLLNQLNNPVENVTLAFESDRGHIDPEATTDSSGFVTLIFEDQGEQEDVGLANITCSFRHPGYDETINDSVQVAITTNYTLGLESYPFSYDNSNSFVIVGEDIINEIAYTLLIAQVSDSSGNPVSGIPLSFSATSSGIEVGFIEILNSVTNSLGQINAIFDDGGTEITDIPGTPSFEGVIASVNYGEDINSFVEFNVYNDSDVWEYSLILTTDTDVIYVDGGLTQATLVARLLNALGNPVMNTQISYESTLGFISTFGVTDSTGVDTIYFTDLGDPNDIGVSNVSANFVHPGFPDLTLTSTVQVSITDTTFAECAFIEIPSSDPDHIVVQEGGGIESTQIRAEIYDDNGNLVDTPSPVTFRLNPVLEGCYLNDANQTEVTVYTVNGIASVSVNSGVVPGVVRIEVEIDCDEDGEIDLSASKDQVIIVSGAPYYIEPEYDPNSTTPTGGGHYQTQIAAIVFDKWYNQVEDTTYVYWTIEPILPDTLIDAFVDGLSFTGNENLDGDAYSGMAFSTIIYSTDAIGDIGYVSATTFGVNGDTISARINEDAGESLLIFVPGNLTLTATTNYWDFTLPVPTDEVAVTITANLIDYYGNPVSEAPILFTSIGGSAWLEVGFEAYEDIGVEGGVGAGDGCFTWRDYGHDDEPGTLDTGEGNDDHDGWDSDGDGVIDSWEVSEPFDDFGLDGVDGTNDEGEGNGEWDGYHLIDCGNTVRTDQDGNALITVIFTKELCIWQSTDEETGICSFSDFPASVNAVSTIPQVTEADSPVEIQLVRSPTNVDCPF